MNFVRQESRTFPGLTALGSAHARRQNLVCSGHGVRAVDELCADRATSWRQCWCAHAVLCRAIPRNGLCATHLAREPARYRGQPVGQCQQAVCDGISFGGQTLYAGRRQRVAQLDDLVGPRGDSYPSCSQALLGRCSWHRSGQHGLCTGLQHHRCLSEPVRVGTVSIDQGRPSSFTRCWICAGQFRPSSTSATASCTT